MVAVTPSNVVLVAKQAIFAHPVLLVVGLLVLSLVYNRLRPGLINIPGPPVAAYTKLWRLYDVWKGQAHMTAIDIHKKYGPVVRIGPNHVSIADPAMIPIIYGTMDNFTKTGFYPIQSISWKKKPELNLFSTRDPEYHRVEKRKVGAAYSLPNLLQSEAAIDSCVSLFMDRLHEFASNGMPVDLGAWLQYFAFDVVGELTFASKFGFLEQGTDVDVRWSDKHAPRQSLMLAVGYDEGYRRNAHLCSFVWPSPRDARRPTWKSTVHQGHAGNGDLESSACLHLEGYQWTSQHQARRRTYQR